MRLLLLSVILGMLQLSQVAYGHSWLECVDYQDGFATITSNSYDRTKCKGFTRGWGKLGLGVQYNFGTANWWPTSLAHSRYTIPDMVLTEPATMGDSANTYTCRYRRDEANNNNATFPSPVYTQGQKIRIVWPGVNHGGPGNGCASPAQDQIDTLHIVCSGDGTDTSGSFGDITIRQMLSGVGLANDLKKTVTTTTKYGTTTSTGKGFKNCPFHCQNTERAFCYSDLTLPSNLPVGQCSLYWLWEFNDRDYYTACWEATILAADGSAPAPAPSDSAPANPTPAPTAAPARVCRRWWCRREVVAPAAAGGSAVAAGAVAGFVIYRRKKRTQGPAHVGMTNEDSKYTNATFL